MSEISRELASWRKGKTPIIAKYVRDHSHLMAEIAGRGFLALPGYAFDIENGFEMMAKMGLSKLNYKILSETIERELKQLGIDYGYAYKNAAMIWEIEKQALMAAWDAEYAGIKQGMTEEEEILNLLAIEISKRAIILLEQKTEIELAMEGYRKTLAELDGSTAAHEVQLANAKVLTARKKLELIPILQKIIDKEQELLATEGTKIGAYVDYLGAEQELAAKKQTLAPVINELASKNEIYATKIEKVQIPMESRIADERMTQAKIAVKKADYRVTELETDIETAEKNLDLMDAKRDLQKTKFEYEQSLLTTETDLTQDYHNKSETQFSELLQGEKSAAQRIRSTKKDIHGVQSATRVTSSGTITNTEKEVAVGITVAERSAMEQKADIDAAVEITAKLIHLIG